MSLTARIVVYPLPAAKPPMSGLPGPGFLDLLAALAAEPGELAALHAAQIGAGPCPTGNSWAGRGQTAESGKSVLAYRPVLTLEITAETNAQGQEVAVPRWISHQDLRLNDLQTPPAGTDPVHAWQQMLDEIILLEGQSGPATDLSRPPGAGPIAPGLPLVGWLGGISYDIGRWIERISTPGRSSNPIKRGWPLLRWTLFDGYFVLDHATGLWTLATFEWSTLREEMADQRLDQLESFLGMVEPSDPPHPPTASSTKLAGMTPAGHQEGKPVRQSPQEAGDSPALGYCRQVQQVQEYIGAGDIYQANLAHCWPRPVNERPETIYRRLCERSPAPYGAYFRFADKAVLCASPELFLERYSGSNRAGGRLSPSNGGSGGTGRYARTCPIKGTRPRAPDDPQRDEALRQELLASPKDQAELAMIVDLLRNDLGRVCQYGSVQVTQPRALEEHPTVWHTVATIEGMLTPVAGWEAIVRAMCPGGSITGAPKIRAMQIIEELEGQRRDWYCGNLGWIGPREAGVLNIAIRTILLEGLDDPTMATAQVWAGSGIVADSEPQAEYEETLAKARAMLEALKNAEC
ncbi:MAG: anthranilate synthase component I family protein [Phycisphaerae bacterium]